MMKRILETVLYATALAGLGGCGSEEPELKVFSPQETVEGRSITDWTESWFRWNFEVPAHQNPALILEADCGVGQDEPVFFVPVYDGDTTYRRTCRVPAAKPVLVPLWVIINDHPCPDPDFQPAPGQTLEDFLTQGAADFNALFRDLRVTVDGQVIDPTAHRHTTRMFHFTADPSLVGKLPDPCLQGSSQPGVSDGWWLMLSLPPGEHVVHVTGVSPTNAPIDYTYNLAVSR
ncbi:hypothetical protein NVS55_10290 [Myxococcus stipitatus]|uniref:hypothetical protein n=1 Tax=Myxococcus stipitatus TaxID=83455 RepID=UPI0031451224